MRRPVLLALVLTAALAAGATPASAFLIQERGGLSSAANGIVLGPDGNLWAAEYVTGTVVRMTPGGEVLAHFAVVGGVPISMAVGPGGRVWASVPAARKLVWFDALSATPTRHDVPTNTVTDCGPVAIADGGNGKMYFSAPKEGCNNQAVGYVNADGTLTGHGAVPNRGRVFDLAVAGGKLFAPDFDGGVVRRMALDAGLTVESTVTTGATPDGIAIQGDRVWVTEYTPGRLAHFPTSQANGAATEITPPGGTLSELFGIVAAADGRIYAAGKASGNLVRVNADGTGATFFATPAGAEPWEIVNGPDGDLFLTDLAGTRILRFLSTPPRTTTGSAAALAATVASVTATVDPRGNDTQVVFDYGPTTAYGSTSSATAVPNGAAPVAVTASLGGLAPSTTYHVRARATNAEGETTGADITFTTPAGVVDADGDGSSPPADCNDANRNIRPGATDTPGDGIDQDCTGADAAFPVLAAYASFTWGSAKRYTLLTRFRLTSLKGGETAVVGCRGRGCPFKQRTFKALKAGTRNLTRLFGRKRRLRVGAKVTVRITAPASVGAYARLTVRRGKAPKITRGCLRPGATAPSRC